MVSDFAVTNTAYSLARINFSSYRGRLTRYGGRNIELVNKHTNSDIESPTSVYKYSWARN